ncbi:cellulase family glycosylhydrolase [Streptomyces verrucosisporus]|uniref:cellulase family glycosylhydrolase n=1 Tax=Streptomyces verrucosisporus TaxID=1695161 RepID=UPI001F124A79|nr:cellulase family glycosylhydrolase [Streptomyces verrucosisporus]
MPVPPTVRPRRRSPLRAAAAALLGLTMAAVPAVTAAASGGDPGTAAAAAVPQEDWLHTEGNQIVDEAGRPVWLTGTNWFGFNTSERVFHGLWTANIETVTRQMAERGINIVRVPVSTQLLLEWRAGDLPPATGINLSANPELEGMTTLEIFEYWLDLCEQYGLKVMLDAHSPDADNTGHIYPVWWKGSITPELFYQSWEWAAERYKDNDTVVAMDIENEPHGQFDDSPRAKWDGSEDVDNFKHACETAGRRILDINPKVLILCEGIETYPKDGKSWDSEDPKAFHNNWWGGNLRGVRDHPVDLGEHQDQLLYSPHDYGPLVHLQPWFEGEWNRETLEADVWDPNWLYLHKENTSPLLIGEWGGFLDGGPNQKWMTALRSLITEERLHHTFWVLNPNSGDTGGLLNSDWTTWDEEKYEFLKPALWQQDGKFVSLDHQVPLGGADSTTGISLAEASGEQPGPDTEAPTAPGGLAAQATASRVSLSWRPATDNVRVVDYSVHRDGVEVASGVRGTSFTDGGLDAETEYVYTVRARDAAGNVSAASAPLTVTTGAPGVPSGDLTVLHRNSDDPRDNAIRPHLKVVNSGDRQIDLADVTVRYWFTRDGGSSVGAWCDWAVVGCSGLELRVVELDIPVDGADAYLEVGFTGGGLAPGADTGDIQLRMSKADWSAFDETDDHSHATSASYTEAPAITASLAGDAAWGAEPH